MQLIAAQVQTGDRVGPATLGAEQQLVVSRVVNRDTGQITFTLEDGLSYTFSAVELVTWPRRADGLPAADWVKEFVTAPVGRKTPRLIDLAVGDILWPQRTPGSVDLRKLNPAVALGEAEWNLLSDEEKAQELSFYVDEARSYGATVTSITGSSASTGFWLNLADYSGRMRFFIRNYATPLTYPLTSDVQRDDDRRVRRPMEVSGTYRHVLYPERKKQFLIHPSTQGRWPANAVRYDPASSAEEMRPPKTDKEWRDWLHLDGDRHPRDPGVPHV